MKSIFSVFILGAVLSAAAFASELTISIDNRYHLVDPNGGIAYTVKFLNEDGSLNQSVAKMSKSGRYIREVLQVPARAVAAQIYIGGERIHGGVYQDYASSFPYEARFEIKQDGETVYSHSEL